MAVAVTVEVGFGSTLFTDPALITWTDITAFVDIVSGISIERGASDEFSAVQPGTCSLLLNNADGRFSPGLASSPYYPYVRKGTPLRVRVATPGRDHHRLWGAVNKWPTKWKGLYATAAITCTDLFALLSRQRTLRSCLDEEVLLNGPLAYYPLTEPSDSLTAGDLSGTTAGPLAITQVGSGGTLAFGTATGPPSTGESVPLLTPVSTSVGKYLTADLGTDFERLSVGNWIHAEAWFTTSTAGRVIMGCESLDQQNQLVFSLSAGGILQAEWVTDGPGSLTVVTTGSANLANGALHHIVYSEQSQQIWVDGVLVSFAGVPFATGLRRLTVGGFRSTRLWSGSIGNVAWYAVQFLGIGPALAGHYTAGTTAFDGETADTRITRIASYTGISSVTVFGTSHDPVSAQGAGGSTALSMMQDIERTESGHLYAERDYIGLAYQGRDVRYNPDPALEVFTIAYADLETDDLEIADDDQKQTNIIVGMRPGGARQRVISQPSIDLYGPYDKGEQSLLKTSDLSVLSAMNWTISRYADPPPEVREVPIEASTLANYADILDGDISEYFSITGMPAEAPASVQRVTIEGYSETITQSRHLIQFRTSRSATDSVWVLGDATYSVLGSTTRLAY